MEILHSTVWKTNFGLLFCKPKIPAEIYPNLFIPVITMLEQSKRNCWFQHDKATNDTAITTPFLLNIFGDRFVGRGLWSPRSPDLTPLVFFLWVFLKERVNRNNTSSLKHNTVGAVGGTSQKSSKFRKKNLREKGEISSLRKCEGGTFLAPVLLHIMYHTYLLTYSIQQSPSWEANWFCS